jgi:hypothetical protein
MLVVLFNILNILFNIFLHPQQSNFCVIEIYKDKACLVSTP